MTVETSKRSFIFTDAIGLILGSVVSWGVAVLFIICFYLSQFMFPNESDASLFQRAGGVVVVLAVVIEYGLLNLINHWLKKNNNLASGKTYRTVSFVMHIKLSCKLTIFLTVIAGTIIWAYGDLIYFKYL